MRLLPPQHLQRTLHGDPGKCIVVLPRGGERRIHILRHHHVVKPGNGDIPAHLQAARFAHTVNCHSHLIICGNDRFQIRCPVQQLFHAPVHMLRIITLRDVLLPEGNPMPVEHAPVAFETLLRILVILRS